MAQEACWRRRRHSLRCVASLPSLHAVSKNVMVKAFPYWIPSVAPGADPGVQAVSPQVTVSHPPGGRLPLLSARPDAVTFSPTEHHRPLAGTKLYCLVTEAHRCEQLAQGCYTALPRVGFEPAIYWSQVQRSARYTTAPPLFLCIIVICPSYKFIKLSAT